ncbi:MAG: TraB/GumN family protein [Gammaproteobacteria bacterium]|nr:TraB/GumN family protein [Gammaproteobacteria bacterium]
MRFFKSIKIKSSSGVLAFIFLLAWNSSLYAHPFLWKVSGDHEFYLFGTIHLPDPRVTDISDEVEIALKQSTSFYAELDLSESNTMMIKQSMWLPEKMNLYDYLSVELEENIESYLKQINPELNLEFFAKQKLWVLAITLTVIEQQLKYPGQLALDAKLFNQAKSLGLMTGGLESVEEQLQVFEQMTVDEQIMFLSDTVEFMIATNNNEDNFIEESIVAYLNGDLDQLMAHLMSYMKDNEFYTDLLDRLIDKRNIRMADTIVSLVSENPSQKYFFAIGAGHFWGDASINNILMNKGYSIQIVE